MSNSTEKYSRRIQSKRDYEVNWQKAENFTPLDGEQIVYKAEVDKEGKAIVDAQDFVNYPDTGYPEGRKAPIPYPRIKVGDGNTNVNNLPFITSTDTDADIKLSAPFTITQDFGYYKLPSGKNSTTVGEAGQSLHDFLQGALANEDKTIFSTAPSCGISMLGGSYEIGSTVTPSASWSTGAGTYKWGTYTNGAANYNDKTTGITYTTEKITIDKTSFVLTEDTTVNASGTATRSAVTKYPCSNLGSDLTSLLLTEYKTSKEISATKSAIFTGYRYAFAGGTESATIDSVVVRSKTAKKSSKNSMDSQSEALEFTVAKGATKIFFAYPSTWSGTPYFEMFGLAWAENGNFVQQSDIPVADYRGTVGGVLQGPTSYKLYVWTPAGPLTADTTKLRVWFK